MNGMGRSRVRKKTNRQDLYGVSSVNNVLM
jgi:hypothetical protein